MTSIMQCKFLRPRIILLEQVRNFESHPHYPKAMQLLTAAGYRVVFSKVIDAGDGCPMTRPRWLAVACDALSKHDFDLATFNPQWLGDLYFHPSSFGCMLPLTQQEKEMMILAPHVMNKYFQPRMAPSCMKHNLTAKRSTRPWQKMPTLMAAYGKQHTFSDEELHKHGLYGHFLAETDASTHQTTQLRLWHPQELAIMLSPVFDVVLMREYETAWKHLGNAITTNHACFLLVAVLPMLLCEPPTLNTRDALLSLLESRLKNENTVVHSHPKCWILTTKEELDFHQHRVENFLNIISQEVGSIPHATFLHADKGVIAFDDIRALWNHQQILHPMLPITPTQTCWMKLQVCVGDTKIHGTFIQPLVAVDQILGLWSFHAATQLLEADQIIDADQFHFQQLLLGCSEAQQEGILDDEQSTILLYHSQQAWIVRAPKNIEGLHSLFPECPSNQFFHTALAIRSNDIIPVNDMVLYAELPQSVVVTTDPCVLINMILHIKGFVHTRKQQDTVILMFDLHRDREQFQDALWGFFHELLPQEWLNKHGRTAHMTMQQGAIQIEIKPNQLTLPLPIPDLLEVILFHFLRSFWATLSHSTTEPATTVRMKWQGQIFWQGSLPSTTVVEVMRAVTFNFRNPLLDTQYISIVAFGKRAGDFATLGDLQGKSLAADLILDGARTLMLAFIPTLTGGGPVKQTWDVEIRNQIAAILLPLGVPVDNLVNIADTVLKSVGRTKLQQILKQSNPDLRKKQLIETVENTGFSIAKIQKAHPKPQPLLKTPRADQIRQELLDMDLDGVQIEPGFFTTGSNDPVQQIDKLYPKSTGIVLTKEMQICEWLTSGQTISPDPLGAFVVGVKDLPTTLQYQTVLIPARTTKGLPLILSGALVQFGDREVNYTPHHDTTGFSCSNDTQVVPVTAWKEEINSDDWQELLRKPSHYMQQAFAEHGPSAIFLSTWGTSHQAKGKPIDKSKAESVQLHATIAKEHLPDALRKSGIHGLYIVPKSAEGNPDQDWKIIWLPTPIRVPGARDEALRNLSKVQQPFGIVRNKSAYGIRVRDTHFTEAWEVIHPQQPIPATIADKIIFKVTPLPFGCPPETVKQWLQHIEWNAVLVRPVGPKSWIVAAPDDPPSQFITFNGNPTLIRRLPSRDAKPLPAVVAGQKLQSTSGVSGPLTSDPWAKYTPTSHQLSSQSAARVSEPAVGLVQKQMQKQDDKIQTLADEINQLRQMQETTQQETANKFKQVEQAFDKTKEIFSHQLSQMKQELESSFQQAITAQNTNINQGFTELKTMFLQTTRTSSNRRTWEEATKHDDEAM